MIDDNRVYEVDCESKEIRDNIADNLLRYGWADLRKFTYKTEIQN